jgi:hypothetical protein
MSVRLFAGYFLALAVCSTLAFASFGPDSAAPQDTLVSNPSVDTPSAPSIYPSPYSLSSPYSLMHRHRAGHLHLQIAQAQ